MVILCVICGREIHQTEILASHGLYGAGHCSKPTWHDFYTKEMIDDA
jgi:hypothetical protein